MIHIANCQQIFKQTPEYLLIAHIVVHWYKHDLCIVVSGITG